MESVDEIVQSVGDSWSALTLADKKINRRADKFILNVRFPSRAG